MKNFFCEIDISQKTLDYAMCNDDKEVTKTYITNNSEPGIIKLIKILLKKSDKDNIGVCCEHTGNYGLLLAKLLKENDIKYSMVSPLEIIRSIGIKRGKTYKFATGELVTFFTKNPQDHKELELLGVQLSFGMMNICEGYSEFDI